LLTLLGICPQRNVLWDELTVEEHIEIWNNIKFSRGDKTALERLIEACDLTSKKGARAGTLSGGQKRKLQLACMFVGGSTVCLLDEVTSGLVSITTSVILFAYYSRIRSPDVLSGTLFLQNDLGGVSF
jgi:ABC-type multidrug transport system ATPase subunit